MLFRSRFEGPQVRVETVIQRLEERRAQLAKEMLEQPSGSDAFNYGRTVGIHTGLRLAVDILVELFADMEEHGRRL